MKGALANNPLQILGGMYHRHEVNGAKELKLDYLPGLVQTLTKVVFLDQCTWKTEVHQDTLIYQSSVERQDLSVNLTTRSEKYFVQYKILIGQLMTKQPGKYSEGLST